MQLLARLMDYALAERGERATIVGATSGDTGGAAIDAFAGRERTDIFILFPHGKVSPVQQRQMTTSTACQRPRDCRQGQFRRLPEPRQSDVQRRGLPRPACSSAGVNSINWARIMAQIVYYFTTAIALGGPDRKISFTVPTGNFGDIFAGYVRQAHGPADRQAGGRHQRERHPGAHAEDRPLRDEATSRRRPRRRWTSRSRRTSNGCCSKPMIAMPPRCALAMDGLKQSGAFEIDDRRAEGDPQGLPRRPRQRKAGRRDDHEDARRDRLPARPAHAPSASSWRKSTRKPNVADGHAGHRAPGKIPRRRKIRLRY